MKTLLALLIIALHSPLYAASIKQLLNSQDLAIVEISKNEKIAVGDNFLANANDKQCLLEVIKIDNKNATVSTKDCTDKSMLWKDQTVEKSLFDKQVLPVAEKSAETPVEPQQSTPQSEPNSSNNGSKIYKAVNLSLGVAIITIPFKATDGSTTDSGTYQFNLKGVVSFGFELSQFDKQSWNNGFQIDYTRADFDTFTVKTNSSGEGSGTTLGSISFITIAYTGKYLWDTFYFPVGLGITSSVLDTTAPLPKTISTGTTAWLGVGTSLSENLNFEIISKSVIVSSSKVTSGTVTITPSSGFLSSLHFNMKILF